jgi:hypothetical protein
MTATITKGEEAITLKLQPVVSLHDKIHWLSGEVKTLRNGEHYASVVCHDYPFYIMIKSEASRTDLERLAVCQNCEQRKSAWRRARAERRA